MGRKTWETPPLLDGPGLVADAGRKDDSRNTGSFVRARRLDRGRAYKQHFVAIERAPDHVVFSVQIAPDYGVEPFLKGIDDSVVADDLQHDLRKLLGKSSRDRAQTYVGEQRRGTDPQPSARVRKAA
ncbi:hypothetical protein [Qipengyuania sp.]|uniref:hypothetical protein n=1 Tax=Qipengyuania sp. TaxID=2004515 RepID=UPI0035C7D8FC